MTRLRSVLVGATAASLLVVPGAATALATGDSHARPKSSSTSAQTPGVNPPAAAARYTTRISFLDFDHIRAYGTKTRVRGQVIAQVGGSQGAVSGVKVQLYRKINGTTDWNKLATKVTSDGRFPKFTFEVKTVASSRYRAVFGGNKQLKPSRDRTSVSTYRLFHAKIEDGTGRFYGRVTPRYGNRKVYLERRTCASCSYRLYKTDRTTAKGKWSFKLNAPRKGKYYWRAYTPANRKFIKSYTGVYTTELK